MKRRILLILLAATALAQSPRPPYKAWIQTGNGTGWRTLSTKFVFLPSGVLDVSVPDQDYTRVEVLEQQVAALTQAVQDLISSKHVFTEPLQVPGIKITGSGPGAFALAAGGTEPAGAAGKVTMYGAAGDRLAVKLGTTRALPVTMGGNLCGDQIAPSVCSFSLTSSASIGAANITISVPNQSTANGLLAKIVDGRAVTATTSDVRVPLRVVAFGGGTSGSAELIAIGRGTCTLDAAGTSGQYLIASTTQAGRCHPITMPATGDWIIGELLTAQGEFLAIGARW
jgi:hypothetical protein